VRAWRAPRGRREERRRLTGLARLLAAGAVVACAVSDADGPQAGQTAGSIPDGRSPWPRTLTIPGGIAVSKDGLDVTNNAGSSGGGQVLRIGVR
jgi:hypothetical protein